MESRSRFDGDESRVRPWLYGIAANLVGTQHRRERSQRKALERLGPPPLSADQTARVDEELLAAAGWGIVMRVLGQLDRDQRETVVLSVWEGLPVAEVAEALGVAEGTVKSRLGRVRERIRDEVRRSSGYGPATTSNSMGEI